MFKYLKGFFDWGGNVCSPPWSSSLMTQEDDRVLPSLTVLTKSFKGGWMSSVKILCSGPWKASGRSHTHGNSLTFTVPTRLHLFCKLKASNGPRALIPPLFGVLCRKERKEIERRKENVLEIAPFHFYRLIFLLAISLGCLCLTFVLFITSLLKLN